MTALLEDLLGLWRGDEETFGYAHEGLAYEICRRLRPKDRTVLFAQLYPGWDMGEVEPEYLRIVDNAYERWRKGGKK